MTRRARAYQARVSARRSRLGLTDPDDPASVTGRAAAPDDTPAAPDGGAAAGASPAGASTVPPAASVPSGAGVLPGAPDPVVDVDGEPFVVRPVSGSAARKPYTCPRCLQQIGLRVPHVVVWPADRRLDGSDGLSVRRHWHRHCWGSEVRAAARRRDAR